MRRFFTTLIFLFGILCAFGASETQIRYNSAVYSKGVFGDKKHNVSSGLSSGTTISMRSMAPMSTAQVVSSASSMPRSVGSFRVSQITAVGQKNLPVIGSLGADVSSGMARVPRPDDGNGGHPDVDQPLGGMSLAMLLSALIYSLLSIVRRVKARGRA